MKKVLLITALVAGTALPTAVYAQERAVDGALGAVAGAVVLGPVGLIAGAAVGATAGPSIATGWGLRHRHHHHYHHEPQ